MATLFQRFKHKFIACVSRVIVYVIFFLYMNMGYHHCLHIYVKNWHAINQIMRYFPNFVLKINKFIIIFFLFFNLYSGTVQYQCLHWLFVISRNLVSPWNQFQYSRPVSSLTRALREYLPPPRPNTSNMKYLSLLPLSTFLENVLKIWTLGFKLLCKYTDRHCQKHIWR